VTIPEAATASDPVGSLVSSQPEVVPIEKPVQSNRAWPEIER
jgi:hypothetical protein